MSDAETGSTDDEAAVEEAQTPAPDLLEVLGGRRGLFDSGVPGACFVLLYTMGGYWWPVDDLRFALYGALATSAILAVVRTMRHESLRQTVFGLAGVALGAVLAARSGNAANFYLPGLFVHAGYASVYLISILVGWPLLGVLIGPLLGEGVSWRKDPARKAMYRRVTWVWVALFTLKLAVQLPLYLAGATIALGVARLVMGLPLFMVAVWITYEMVRSAPPPEVHLGDPRGGS